MNNDWNGEYCQKCGKPYKYVYNVSDKLWKRIVNGRYNLLCIDCLFDIAEEKGIYIKFIGKE